ncbi:hypothetical protein D3C72_790250 [compost metagenome]
MQKIVHIVRAEGQRKRLVDLPQLHAERAGMDTIDLNIELRRGRHAIQPDAGQHRTLRSRRHHGAGRRAQARAALARAVLHLERKAGGVTHRGNRRRIKREDLRLRDREKGGIAARHQGIDRPFAFRPGVQVDEGQRRRLALAEETEADD